MLKAAWGRVGSAAADGRRVAQAAAARSQRRQEPPNEPAPAWKSGRCNEPAPAWKSGRSMVE